MTYHEDQHCRECQSDETTTRWSERRRDRDGREWATVNVSCRVCGHHDEWTARVDGAGGQAGRLSFKSNGATFHGNGRVTVDSASALGQLFARIAGKA